jgi:hypothetical protein
MVRKYSTISVETTLASGINASQTSMVVATGTGTTLMGGISLTAGDTFAVAIDPETSSEEIVYITAVASDTFTITRAQAGSAGVAHNAGATVQHVFTGNDAQHFEDIVTVALTASNTATVTNKDLSSGTNTFPSSLATLTGTQTLTNKTLTAPTINNAASNYPTLKSPQEIMTLTATAATGTVNYDAKTQSVLFYQTDATGNWVLNVRGDSSTTLTSLMDVGDSITVTFLVTQGSTAYYNTSVQIDGTTTGVTTRWQGGTAPTSGNASSVDAYTYAIAKTAATPTFSVFASQTKFA